MLKRVYVFIQMDLEWVPCGILEYEEQGRLSSSTFRYGKRYLQRPSAIAIDPVQLPLLDQSISTPNGFAIFNGIRDAGPDAWGRYLLDKKFSRSLTEIEYIAAASSDRVGALGFSNSLDSLPGIFERDESFKNSTRPRRLKLDQALGAADDATRTIETERLNEYLSYGPSMGGARPKANVELFEKLYLAKFTLERDKKDEALIEFATMSLAKASGLNVPEIRLEKINDRSVFLIKRFDREKNKRTPFISGLTATGIHESDYASWSYFAIVDAILKFSDRPETDLKELFRRMVFNIAVYNNDDHLRNFGFLSESAGSWNLSPLYDVVPTAVRTETYAQAMTVGKLGKQSSYTNALSMSDRFRISQDEARDIINDVDLVVRGWRKHFVHLGVKNQDIDMIENSFKSKP